MPKRTEGRDSNRHLYISSHCSIIYNSQEVETNQMSINKKTDKQNVTYTNNEISCILKKECNSDPRCNTSKPWKQHAEWNKQTQNKKILYNSTCMQYWEQATPQRNKVERRLPGSGKDEWENYYRTGTESVWDYKKVLEMDRVVVAQYCDTLNVINCTSSVQSSRSVVSDSLRPQESQHPGLPVHHQLLEFTQTHVHRVGDAIQPSHPLSSPSPPAPSPSQHQSLFQWVSSSHEVAKVLEFQL